ncbi:LysR family transcriptional regulator [Alicyclobacillus tolerans]|uniref:LysR family transcriptional regulator n=1 Tax=Alicyclobacillus tolerans TaxID=90970 RepID=UPI001F34C883|nr:LysR family transcriptional regulator [Alicyclobacillus tolerans]MCF8566377.1 LysR family transcriptional regulator [Alicyclobacillus tolerans]
MDNLLTVFAAVAEKKSFSRAAEELHLTQPGVSLQIQALEKEYGTKLLERTNKSVRLTKAGEILYFHAKQIMHEYDQAKRRIDDLVHTASGRLGIGASYTFGEYILPYVVSSFRLKYPDIVPAITIENTHQVADQIMRRELDVGIVEGELEHPNLVVRPFAPDAMVIIVPAGHRWTSWTQIDPKELETEPWIVREPGSGTREVANHLFSDLGFQPKSMMEFGSTQVVKEAVEAGLGIALISERAITKERILGTLHPLTITGHPVIRHFSWVTHRAQFHTKALDLFIEFLGARMQQFLP